MNKLNIKEVFIKKVCDKNKIKINILYKRKEGNFMKKYVPYLMGVIIICILGVYILTNKSDKVIVHYNEYLKENKVLSNEKANLKNEKNILYEKFNKGLINDKEYNIQDKNIDKKIEGLNKKLKELKKDYKIKDNMNLSKYKFSNDPKMDKKLKDLYLKEQELEKKEDELDIQEHKLKEQFRKGEIDKNTYINKKREIEKKEDEIDAIEDEYDLLEDEIDAIEDAIEEEKDELEDIEDEIDDD